MEKKNSDDFILQLNKKRKFKIWSISSSGGGKQFQVPFCQYLQYFDFFIQKVLKMFNTQNSLICETGPCFKDVSNILDTYCLDNSYHASKSWICTKSVCANVSYSCITWLFLANVSYFSFSLLFNPVFVVLKAQ